MGVEMGGVKGVGPASKKESDPLKNVEGKKIRKSQLDGLKELASSNNISLKEILKKAKVEKGFVTSLDLSWENIYDIRALAKLTNLKELDLSLTKASEVNTLAKLINLEELDLTRTLVHDISALTKLPKLRYLNVAGTSITNSQLQAFKKSRAERRLPPVLILRK